MIRSLLHRVWRISWKLKVVFIFLLIILGVLLSATVFSNKKNGYIMGFAQKQTITEIVTESGTVTTAGRVNVYSPTTGVVNIVYVSNGASVSAGQKLFSVKSTATAQEKATAFAAYRAAASAVQQAENNRRSTESTVARVHNDLKDKSTTENYSERETRTSAEVANDNAYDALISARAQLASAEANYHATQNSVVAAPIAGVVSNLSVVKGSGVQANNILAPVSPVLIIDLPAPTEIMISIGETNINKIKIGQEVSVKLDAVNDKIYRGTVVRFDENGTAAQGVVKFSVYIDISDPDSRIKSGMTADVDIVTNTLQNVVSVSNSAVKPYQKGRAVRILGNGGKMEYLPVKIGLKGREYTQITEGLTEGREIIVSLSNEKTPKTNPFGY